MIVTAHLVTGAFIGKALKKEKYIIPVSLLSHYVLDSIIHWHPPIDLEKLDLRTLLVIFGDISLALLLLSIVLVKNKKLFYPIFLGSFFAVIPDIDLVYYIFFPFLIENPPLSFFWNFHVFVQHDISSPLGLIPQLLVIFFGLNFLLRKNLN